MIKTIIFDFGDVFINLDKQGAMKNALELFKLDAFPKELHAINSLYEQGLISTEEFLDFYKENFPYLKEEDIIDAWNFIIKDFPIHRLEFIQKLATKKQYKLILLSNTNEMHINYIKELVSFYEDFKTCFDIFYLSHEIFQRKPDATIFEFVLNESNLKASETLFIDDTKENVEAAAKLGIHTWHIDEISQDVCDLFAIKSELF